MIMHTSYRYFLAIACLLLGVSSAQAQFPRTVVIEEFTAVTCTPCVAAGHNIDEVVAINGAKVVAIRNQVNYRVNNPYSTTESEGRKVYYDVNSYPSGFLNGLTFSVGERNVVITGVEDALAVTSPLKIEVTQTREGGTFTVSVKVTAADQAFDGIDHRIHVVALEREITDTTLKNLPFYNGEETIRDVMRKMLAGGGGAEFSIDANATKTFTYTYDLGPTWQGDKMYVAAFVQNTTTKAVLQAGFSPRPALSGVPQKPLLPAGYSFDTPAPNPAANATFLRFTLGQPSSARLSVHDVTGRLVRSVDIGRREAGPVSLPLDLDGLASGAYTCTIEAEDVRMTQSLIVR